MLDRLTTVLPKYWLLLFLFDSTVFRKTEFEIVCILSLTIVVFLMTLYTATVTANVVII